MRLNKGFLHFLNFLHFLIKKLIFKIAKFYEAKLEITIKNNEVIVILNLSSIGLFFCIAFISLTHYLHF